jgi:hypothetical protein
MFMSFKSLFTIAFLIFALCVMPVYSEPVEIYIGEAVLTDELVSIVTSQGEIFEIPANTPLGLLQLLAEEGEIDSYVASSKVYEKKGILLLDGINGLMYSGDSTWFVTVNGYQLEDFVESDTEGLNIYELPACGQISYWYGLPILPTERAEVVLTVFTVDETEDSCEEVN